MRGCPERRVFMFTSLFDLVGSLLQALGNGIGFLGNLLFSALSGLASLAIYPFRLLGNVMDALAFPHSWAPFFFLGISAIVFLLLVLLVFFFAYAMTKKKQRHHH